MDVHGVRGRHRREGRRTPQAGLAVQPLRCLCSLGDRRCLQALTQACKGAGGAPALRCPPHPASCCPGLPAPPPALSELTPQPTSAAAAERCAGASG